jgi:hypothetical protein
LNAPVSKTGMGVSVHRGFESPPLRANTPDRQRLLGSGASRPLPALGPSRSVRSHFCGLRSQAGPMADKAGGDCAAAFELRAERGSALILRQTRRVIGSRRGSFIGRLQPYWSCGWQRRYVVHSVGNCRPDRPAGRPGCYPTGPHRTELEHINRKLDGVTESPWLYGFVVTDLEAVPKWEKHSDRLARQLSDTDWRFAEAAYLSVEVVVRELRLQTLAGSRQEDREHAAKRAARDAQTRIAGAFAHLR